MYVVKREPLTNLDLNIKDTQLKNWSETVFSLTLKVLDTNIVSFGYSKLSWNIFSWSIIRFPWINSIIVLVIFDIFKPKMLYAWRKQFKLCYNKTLQQFVNKWKECVKTEANSFLHLSYKSSYDNISSRCWIDFVNMCLKLESCFPTRHKRDFHDMP